ncbi:acyltransferase family protein [Sodalis sp. RH15]|uniref:acyltransferase family protein n=1 Tax=Sodalis sp. RH15 TaxID=3394330 RepID=UPI0039B6CFB3
MLRAIASMMVVIYHITIKAGQYNNSAFQWVHIGQYGVDLFFIISGYIMCFTTSDKNIHFGEFLMLRIKRIIPLYWAMTTVALIIYIIVPSLVNSSGGQTSIIASYTLIPNGQKLLVQNGWTLSYEFLFYIIFGLSLNFKKTGLLKFNVFVISLMIFIGSIYKFQNVIILFLTDPILSEFLYGMLAYRMLSSYKTPIIICIISLLIGIFLIIIQNQYGIFNTVLGRSLSGGVPMLFVFIGLVGMEKYIARVDGKLKSILLILGNSSYSLYLIHPFVLSASALVLKKLHLSSISLIFGVTLLLSSVICGIILFKYIENPINNMLKVRKLEKKPTTTTL